MNKVSERQIRMVQQHARPGKPHNQANFIAHIEPIAMIRAMRTNWLIVPETAVLQPVDGVLK